MKIEITITGRWNDAYADDDLGCALGNDIARAVLDTVMYATQDPAEEVVGFVRDSNGNQAGLVKITGLEEAAYGRDF